MTQSLRSVYPEVYLSLPCFFPSQNDLLSPERFFYVAPGPFTYQLKAEGAIPQSVRGGHYRLEHVENG